MPTFPHALKLGMGKNLTVKIIYSFHTFSYTQIVLISSTEIMNECLKMDVYYMLVSGIYLYIFHT